MGNVYFYLITARPWLWAAGILLGAIALGLVVHKIIFRIADRLLPGMHGVIDRSLATHSRKPLRLLLPLLALLAMSPLAPLPKVVRAPIQHAIGLALILSCAWLVGMSVSIFSDVLTDRYRLDVEDNLRARKIHTQIGLLRRVVMVVVGIITVALMLMTFPEVRSLGTSLLASAGLVGLVVGMAMRPTLASLIAGIQIAFTEPIRLDDAVIVEGEWGWIEEITTTYVVVRTWDLRRLLLPLTYFIEKPFQNWTRVTANLIGSVILFLDYTAPLEELRQELKRILDGTKLWDGKVWVLEVTDATEHTMQLRALMSAANASATWDLRCLVREKLIAFLQEHHPACLPKTRAEFGEVKVLGNGNLKSEIGN